MIDRIENLQNSMIGKIYFALVKFANKYLFSALLFFMRFWMAKIFWYAGLTKISSWQSTVYLEGVHLTVSRSISLSKQNSIRKENI